MREQITIFKVSEGASKLHAKHANARGSGGMPSKKFLKITCSEIDSGSSFARKSYLIVY